MLLATVWSLSLVAVWTTFNVFQVAQGQENTEVALVIEPFEYAHSEYHWTISGDVNHTFSPDALFGRYALQLTLNEDSSEDSMYQGIVERGIHRCHNAEYLSIWYKVLDEMDSAPTIRLSLYSDFACSATSSDPAIECLDVENLDELTIFDFEVDPSSSSVTDWQELRMYDIQDFDLRRIKGYKIEIHSSAPVSVLFDQLACHGDGTMFELLILNEGQDQETLLDEGSLEIVYYQSALSENQTTILLGEDGTTYFDYLLEQTETWGGFVLLAAGTAASAYYNMSEAANLVVDYNVIQAATEPTTSTIRIILEDSSDCFEDCESDGLDTKERWYSFHAILDQQGSGQLVIPLEGDTDPGKSFWLTGWAGGIGNSQFDLDYIKSIIIELNVDSSMGIGGTVQGTFELSNIHVTAAIDDGVNPIVEGTDRCVLDESMYAYESFETMTKHEYRAYECCEICLLDPDCLFATTSSVGHCYTASNITDYALVLTGTVSQRNKVNTIWMDDATKRGDFCEKCDCNAESLTIDCRGKNLLILPKTFSESWSPKILDLRDNPRLAFIGSNSFEPSVAASLEQLHIGGNTAHIEDSNFESLVSLKTFSSDRYDYNNIIIDPTRRFSDVCCSRGKSFEIGSETMLTFCEMEPDAPGVDSVYNDFEHYLNAFNIEVITETSDFMSEAAESAEKCAAYCQINQDCLFFSYDARVKNAQHVCYLLGSQGTETETVCCDADHYADFDQTLPGWVSGWPPQTRHDRYNARVLFSAKELEANSNNNFEVEYEISLGADPIRGSVWIEPTIVTTAVGEIVDLTITPPQVVLYDSRQTATVKITTNANTKASTVLIRNLITSCDEAFTFTEGSDDIVIVSIIPEPSDSNAATIASVVSGVLVLLVLGGIVFGRGTKRRDISLWQVTREELTFSDPVQVIGRGTFGLVLLAEYRGTAVAVKRVIPPKHFKTLKDRPGDQDTSANQGTESEDIDNESSDRNTAIDMTGEPQTFDPVSSWGLLGPAISNISASAPRGKFSSRVTRRGSGSSDGTTSWRTMREEFIEEMCYLSKLRHPCITTVMGAVIEPNTEPMLVMEYMEHGSLYDLLHNETLVIEGEILLPILRDISQGMRFLHAAKPEVIHGDLKAHNILVDSKFRAKVADFGLSHKASGRSTGTPYWMAPELLRGETFTNTTTDVYSFGIILYEVFSRKDPYEGEDPVEVLRLIMDREIKKRPPFPKNCPPQLQGLMAECLRDDPGCRPSFEEVDIRLKREDVDTVQPSDQLGLKKNSKQISMHDIFPKHVADALVEGRTLEPEHRECVTIFFCDIINFTEISSRLDPRKIANLLDRLYTKFDELTQKHDVFKVETIGDAYMAVTNLVKDQSDDHVKRIAAFAVDAIEAANGTMIDLDDHDLGMVHIRAGFHCGPIVADVVGTRNPRYCLFGDSVNTASRMESNSKSDRIHCTDTAAELLMKQDPSIPLKSRGNIPIKGKGILHTYWVNERPRNSVEEPVRPKSRTSLVPSDISMLQRAAKCQTARVAFEQGGTSQSEIGNLEV